MKVSLAAEVEPGRMAARPDTFHCVDAAIGLFAIAEGRGPTGGLASRTLVRALRQFIVERADPDPAAAAAGAPAPLPSHRLHVGLMVAYRALLDGEARGPQEAVALSALLVDGARIAIARFGGCGVYRLRDARFDQLQCASDRTPASMSMSTPRADQDEPSLALTLHDLTARVDDHWLLATSGLPDQLSPDTSRLVIDAADVTQRTTSKPLIDVTVSGSRTPRQLVIVGAASIASATSIHSEERPRW